jgi:hypothetical protein
MDKELEDQFYEQVAHEIAANNYQPAPMARAVEKSAGNPDLAKSLYVKFRVEQLTREFKQETQRRQLEAEQHAREQSRLQAIALEKRRLEERVTEKKKLALEKQQRRQLAVKSMKLERKSQRLQEIADRKRKIERIPQTSAERKATLTSLGIALLVIVTLMCLAFFLS